MARSSLPLRGDRRYRRLRDADACFASGRPVEREPPPSPAPVGCSEFESGGGGHHRGRS